MPGHLKPYQHYSDIYDRQTVEACRRYLTIETGGKKYKEALKKVSKDEAKRAVATAHNLFIYFYTGDRYLKKKETIDEWMAKDIKRDKFFEEALPPEDITCLSCGRLMFVSSKHLDIGFYEDPDRVMFFYDCPLDHLPRRVFYNNGQEFIYKKPCPNCEADLTKEHERSKEKIITIFSCTDCDYRDQEEMSLSVKKDKINPDLTHEQDRKRFCLDEEQGQQFIREQENIKGLGRLINEIEERSENKDKYQAVADIKKLKIIELEELLVPVVEKAEFIRFQLKEPSMNKYVVIPFVVYDKKADRDENESKKLLGDLIKSSLEGTNWRLMSEGVSYRLGMLEGRFRAYEQEDDLLKLI